MSESNNLPQAISHKKLSYLMLKAQKESHFSDELAEIREEDYDEKPDVDISGELEDELDERDKMFDKCMESNMNFGFKESNVDEDEDEDEDEGNYIEM